MPAFRRPPRLRQVAETIEMVLPTPPAQRRPNRRPSMGRTIMLALLPSSLAGGAMVAAGLASGNETVMFGAVTMIAMGFSTVVTMSFSRRDEDARVEEEQREYDHQLDTYEDTITDLTAQAERANQREALINTASLLAPSDLLRNVVALAPSVWERRPGDDDFLELRVGTGRRRTSIKFNTQSATQDPDTKAVIDRLSWHEAAPLSVKLPAGTLAGMYGADEQINTLLAWLIFQAAAQHAPWELNIVVLSRDVDLCAWSKWLPHCGLKNKGAFQPLVARTGAEAGDVLRAVANDLRSRAGQDSGPRHLLIADGRGWPSLGNRLERWLGEDVRKTSLLVIQNRFEELSGDCDFVLNLSGPQGRIQRRVEESEPPVFTPDGIWAADASRGALALASIEVSEEERHTPIPSTARLGDLLGSTASGPQAIEETWQRTRSRFRLAAPIGVGPDESVVEIDFRRDGPHGLIAGTTGSGKSEFLQSLVVSLAARVPPDLLNFLLIDFKGGAAFREIAGLPHVVGVVTDLDERLAARALTSLRAEMRRREALFSSVTPAANNIIDYQGVARRIPLANLIIIIDEFHRLVAEQPDFIDEMVQIAQLGRSLGIHLLLATQKPSGVITDHIRANTNLRISLRVTDEADSRDVLGGPEASLIPRDLPGRVYIRAGNESLVVCQAGRVSGLVAPRVRSRRGVEAKAFLPPLAPPSYRRGDMMVRALNVAVADVEAEPEDMELVDERAALIDAIREASDRSGFPEQKPPWQPHLEEKIDLESLEGSARNPDETVIGILDEPEIQRQGAFAVDLDAGHIIVAGGSDTGKTTALLTIAAAAARMRSPSDLHIYAIDYAGGGLLPLEGLAHCGGVALQHDMPRVAWVVQALRDFVGERLRQLSESGTGMRFPRILVLVDNFPAFYSALQSAGDAAAAGDGTDDLTEIMDLGRSVGVTFAITAERPEALRAAVISLLQTRLVLDLQDPTGYSVFGISGVKRVASSIAGRALVPGRFLHEVQIAWPETTLESLRSLRRPSQGGVLEIAPLAAEVPYAPLVKLASLHGTLPGLLLGNAEGTQPLFVHPRGSHLAVLGPRRSGRSNTLAVAATEAQRVAGKLFIINPRRSPALRGVEPEDGSEIVYAERLPDVEMLLNMTMEEAATRQRAFVAGEEDFAPWSIVIDDIDALDIQINVNDALSQLVLRGADLGATLFVTADTQALRATYPSGVTRSLLNQRTGILLAPNTPDDFDHFGVRGKPGRMPPGRGYYCTAGTKHSVQIALLESTVAVG